MNTTALIVLGGAIVVAVLVALLVQMALGGKKEEVKVAAAPKVEILVASKDLGVGKTLKGGDLKWQTWPKDNLLDRKS